jgi:hypothetical protein
MIPLLLLAYSHGIRSSRQIERLCARDIAYRIVACNTLPDHSTIARFRNNFRSELKELFVEVLELCRQAGLIKLGAVAIDGTKIKANAAMEATRTRAQLAQQIETMLAEAQEADKAEDAKFGKDKRGDELPESMRSPASRRAALRAAKERQQRLEQAYEKADGKARQMMNEYDEKVVRQAERRHRSGKASGPPKPPSDEQLQAQKANTTDSDSAQVKARSGFMQGYNAQAAVTAETQIIVAARIAPSGCDTNQLPAMIHELERTLDKAGVKERIGAITADAGYWCHESMKSAYSHFEQQEPDSRTQIYVAVPGRYGKIKDASQAAQPPPEGASLIHRLEHQQRSAQGQAVYKTRAQTIEPVFGQIKSGRQCRSFMQREFDKVDAEWTLMCTTHNLLKLWRHKLAQLN